MDIFFGSSAPIPSTQNACLHNILTSISAEHVRNKNSLSAHFSAWNSPRGDLLTYSDANYEIIFDGYLHPFSQSHSQTWLLGLANRIIDHNEVLRGTESGVFNIAMRIKETGDIYLANDPGGLFPLYYGVSGKNFYFFSHLYLAAQILSLQPDYLGILTKILLGYTLGSRTVFSSFQRINPGEIVSFRMENGEVTTRSSEAYFTQYHEYDREQDDLVWDTLRQPFSHLANQYKTFGVMLSEGFDSRLVAGLAQDAGLQLYTFTHGTRATRGTQITSQLAEALHAHHQFDGLENGLPADPVDLQKQLLLCDNFTVPYWIDGSRYFQQANVDVISAGTALDSSLGGHAFYKPANDRFSAVTQRYMEIVKQDLGLLGDEYIERLSEDLLSGFRRALSPDKAKAAVNGRFKPDVALGFANNLAQVGEELEGEIERVRSTGSKLSSQLLQRFFFENRARKYSFGQELTIRIYNRVVVPSYEPVVMRLLGSINPRHKLHHQVYLRLFRRRLPNLAGIDNGGFGLPISYPRLILETSRFIAKYSETRFIARFLQSKGTIPINQIRSVAFTEVTARQGKALGFFDEFFAQHADILNSAELRAWTDRIRTYRARSYDLGNFYQCVELCQILKGSF